MPAETVYKNAPLVEVIAELHWKLRPLQLGPDVAIDPFFDLFLEQITAWATAQGYPHIQRLIPTDIPTEYVPRRPHIRFRAGESKWPLFQIGPGLFTINVVPPYGGWSSFRKTVSLGIQGLFESYPLAAKSLELTKVELRYVDGFTAPLRREPYNQFISQHLNLAVGLTPDLQTKYLIANEDQESIVEITFKSQRPIGSVGVIRIEPGTSNGKEAAVGQFRCKVEDKAHVPNQPDKLVTWFDSAHESISDWFENMISDELKARMGPREPVKPEGDH